jgi:RNA polymerase sigma-70 factor (family 1)
VDAISDDDLISMYRNGDAEAFEVLFDRYYRSVFNFALYMVHDSGRAEDILQETFLAVARTAKRYEPKGHFRTWLMRIVRNRCLNCLEAERVRREVLKEAAVDAPDACNDPTPEQCVQADELSGQLRRLVMDLPERQREAIVLFAFEKMSYQEIAESLDLPLNTVKTLIYRARAELARSLETEEETIR